MKTRVSLFPERVIETAVLVVGGGGAGAAAAVAAGSAGLKVLVAVKGRLGNSGSTIMASAVVEMDGESAFRSGQWRADRKLTRDVLFRQIVQNGFFLSEQDLAEQFVSDAAPRVLKLLEWGRRAGQRFIFGAGGSWLTSGRAVGRACRQGVRETEGITLLEDVMICDLLTRDGRIAGAAGLDLLTGELFLVKCRAVILASGGYQPFSFKCTHSGNTGDGIAMAYRAGASLADMEFQLFSPGVLLSPRNHRGSILPLLLYGTGQIDPDIVNRRGRSVVDGMPPDVRKLAQDRQWFKLVHAFYWSRETASGGGTAAGGLYFDFKKYSKLRYYLGLSVTFSVFKRLYRNRYRYQGREIHDLLDRIKCGGRWEVGLCAEYSLGGVMVDRKMATTVPGLFAAGEAASGTFGATRTARALTEMLVHGHRAGNAAAAYARDSDSVSVDRGQTEAILRRLLEPFRADRTLRPGAVQEEIEAAADRGFGLPRDREGLETALAAVVRIGREEVPALAVSDRSRVYNYEWIQALQVENLQICLEAGLRAALMRTESRGHHLRSDYPQVDHDRWLCRILVGRVDGKMACVPRPPVHTRLPTPGGRCDSVIDYIRSCR